MRQKRKSIPPKVKFLIWSQPCAICGCRYRICVDHIVPLCKGGSNHISNLQPLCEPCNLHKAGRLTNEEMRRWFASDTTIRTRHKYLEDTQYINPYDRPGIELWMAQKGYKF